jgi:hypothetical protein
VQQRRKALSDDGTPKRQRHNFCAHRHHRDVKQAQLAMTLL